MLPAKNASPRRSSGSPRARRAIGNTKSADQQKETLMLGVKPYINFKGNCEEAVNFYVEQLGAEVLFMGRYGDSPMKGQAPDEKVLHCTFKIGDSHVMACDSVFEEYPVIEGNNITLAIGTNDTVEA